jgi:hypothetical protein
MVLHNRIVGLGGSLIVANRGIFLVVGIGQKCSSATPAMNKKGWGH